MGAVSRALILLKGDFRFAGDSPLTTPKALENAPQADMNEAAAAADAFACS
jgi:hypothetical protein